MRGMTMGAALVLVLSLVGCAQPPKKQAFNQAAATHIKTIAVSQDPNQERYEAILLAHPGMNFGLIGGLIAAADMQAKSTRLTDAMDPAETRLQERFGDLLDERLTGIGYAPVRLVLPKDTKESEMLAAAKKLSPATDAIMTIRLYGGYMAAGPGSDYFPRLGAKVVLVETASGKTLYEDQFTYGYTMPNVPSVHFASDNQYRYANIDALVAEPAKTREGLLAGMAAIATQISDDLKRP